MGCAAAPVKPSRFYNWNAAAGFRAASRPNAGQARSPQQARSPGGSVDGLTSYCPSEKTDSASCQTVS
ncbi:hypothetical protein BFW87_27065 [Pseudomonas fluorescens]|uniref:Uncharacterized protein n=1 Tax=Pseudomonas fluorescens TaxID=294 RepID=A0A1T2Y0W0_PSEFL|nr:hypothetical protein BFW87_27065 [Pseudomonas fluorescens]